MSNLVQNVSKTVAVLVLFAIALLVVHPMISTLVEINRGAEDVLLVAGIDEGAVRIVHESDVCVDGEIRMRSDDMHLCANDQAFGELVWNHYN